MGKFIWTLTMYLTIIMNKHLCILLWEALAASRFVPHPPNFTSLLALSFYVPAILGIIYLPALLISFFITDFFIGFHSVTLLPGVA